MTTPLASHPLSSRSSSLGARLLAGVGTLTLLAAIGLFASRPARTAGGPVPVTVANAPLAVVTTGGTPVEGFINVATSSSSSSFDNLVYTVPAGKQLIVESMTLFPQSISPAPGYSALVMNTDGVGNTVSFSTVNAGPGTGAFSAATQPMHMHVGPGGAVLVSVFKTSGRIDVIVSLSGHLEDAP